MPLVATSGEKDTRGEADPAQVDGAANLIRPATRIFYGLGEGERGRRTDVGRTR
jgi:hypothetical protein